MAQFSFADGGTAPLQQTKNKRLKLKPNALLIWKGTEHPVGEAQGD